MGVHLVHACMCMCVYVHTCANVYTMTHVWRLEDNLQAWVLLPSCGSWRWNSGSQPWQQMHLPVVISQSPPQIGHLSLCYMLSLKNLFPKSQLLGFLNKEEQTFALFLLDLRSFILTFETTV